MFRRWPSCSPRLFSVICAAVAVSASVAGAVATLPAFPGAEGFGAVSAGGRGGRVIHVTNLNDSGPGSFREAMVTKGSRIIVFDVGGTIELKSGITPGYTSDHVTIAGQTAPGGITLIGAEVMMPSGSYERLTRASVYEDDKRASDIIARHLRVRGIHNGPVHEGGGDCSGLNFAKRGIMDHCSFTGAFDEELDSWKSRDCTFQWCTIEESALWGQGAAQHHKGNHNLGGIMSGPNVSVHNNLFAFHAFRCPKTYDPPATVINNVTYRGRAQIGGRRLSKKQGPFIVIGNYFKEARCGIASKWVNPGGGNFYVADNLVDNRKFWLQDNRSEVYVWKWKKGLDGKELERLPEVSFRLNPVPAREAFKRVLQQAGAWPRDATTRRTMKEVKTRTGEVGLHGPYERFAARTDGPTSEKFDRDRDGMPDEWEKTHGLNPKDPEDRNRIVPKGASRNDRHAGFTYVEYYLNELADKIVGVEGRTCTVEVSVEGDGRIVCGHGGFTFAWRSPLQSPSEIPWGRENTFNQGSMVVLKALASPKGKTLFSHWSGGTVDGSKEALLRLKVTRDMKLVAHFRPNPKYQAVVKGNLRAQDSPFQAEVKLFQYPMKSSEQYKHGNYSLSLGRDGSLYSGIAGARGLEFLLAKARPASCGDKVPFWAMLRDEDGALNFHLYKLDPGTGKFTDLGGAHKGTISAPIHQARGGELYFAARGRFFRHSPQGGIKDLGKMFELSKGWRQCFLHADEERGKFYILDNRGHFIVWDLKSGAWQDKGAVFPGRRGARLHPARGFRDKNNGLYVIVPAKKGKIFLRYDMANETLETARMTPGQWVQAVTPDGETAYALTTDARLYRFRFSDWPHLKMEDLGLFDPQGRSISAHNLSVTRDGKLLVIAGKRYRTQRHWPRQIVSEESHGIWAYELGTGKKHLVADTTALLAQSIVKDTMNRRAILYTNSNTVDKHGWIYISLQEGFSTEDGPVPARYKPEVRLMALRVTRARSPGK